MRLAAFALMAFLTVANAAEGVVKVESTKQFDELIAATKGTVIVDFYADWCGPCKLIAPLLDDLAKANIGTVTVLKVDVDQHGELAQRHEISSIPALIKFRAGKKVDSVVGALGKDELAAWAAK